MQQEITQIVFAYTDFIMLHMQIRPKQFVDKRYTHFDMNENEQFYSFFLAILLPTPTKYDQACLHIPDSWYLPQLTVIFSVTDI